MVEMGLSRCHHLGRDLVFQLFIWPVDLETLPFPALFRSTTAGIVAPKACQPSYQPQRPATRHVDNDIAIAEIETSGTKEKELAMKTLIILLSFVAAFGVRAQSTNGPATTPAVTNAAPTSTAQALEAQTSDRFQRTFVFRETKPNEIVKGNATYSGIAIEAAKKRNPLQLFNPFAPVEYGSPEDNVVRDPINGRVTGLKLFAIRF